uniref:hypothetical protein n=2 Tax=Leptospira borgpetersenii TaxID=174 RepID=UPI0020149D9F
ARFLYVVLEFFYESRRFFFGFFIVHTQDFVLCTSPNLAFEATLSFLAAAVGREVPYYESLEDIGTLLLIPIK